MDLNLKGKRALVCGGSQGIGRACGIELARLGARVTLLARTESKLLEALPLLEGRGHTFIACDLTNRNELRDLVEKQMAADGPYQILINNAGGPPSGPILEASAESFLNAFHAHLLSHHLLAKLLVPGMREAGYGRIINIISTSVKAPLPNLGVSNTIRGAVANWSKTLANEVGKWGITVNCVLPGATETERLEALVVQKSKAHGISIEEEKKNIRMSIPLERIGRPQEIAAAVAFLASPAASYVSGVALPVDGGRTPNL